MWAVVEVCCVRDRAGGSHVVLKKEREKVQREKVCCILLGLCVVLFVTAARERNGFKVLLGERMLWLVGGRGI